MENQVHMKIVVGTNTLSEIQQPAYVNHCQFWFRLGRSYPHIDFVFSAPPRMSIDRMRNMTAKVALQVNADYILFLDDDVITPPNLGLQHLLDCEADIAAGRVCVRGWPFDYMTFNATEEDPDGMYIAHELPKNGIVDCNAVGFSFALIKVDLIRRMEEPWFVTGTNNTEDIYFCKRARTLDPNIKIKTNCDCQCGHILWPEVLSEHNRDAFKKYMVEMNPYLATPSDPKKAIDACHRGNNYLKMVVSKVDKQLAQEAEA